MYSIKLALFFLIATILFAILAALTSVVIFGYLWKICLTLAVIMFLVFVFVMIFA